MERDEPQNGNAHYQLNRDLRLAPDQFRFKTNKTKQKTSKTIDQYNSNR